MLTLQKNTRKQELVALITEGSTDKSIFEELMSLNEVEVVVKRARAENIAQLLKSIAELEVQFKEIHSAFSMSQIEEVAISLGLLRAKSTSLGVRSARAIAGRDARRTGVVLIRVANLSGMGAPATYNQGQAKPRHVPKAFKSLFERSDVLFEAELAKHYTDEGKAYFASAEGQEELAKFVQFVKVGKELVKGSGKK
jgi:hypothetical protein